METARLYSLFRSNMRDEATPYLWSDLEVFAYMDDAQKMFCRLTGGISDSTSPITKIVALEGQQYTDVSPKILKIRHAHNERGVTLKLLNFEDLECGPPVFDYGWPIKLGFTMDEGPLRGIVLNEEPNKVRWVRTPERDEVVSLIVYRLPLIDIEGPSDQLEIDDRHHLHILDWMAHLAYGKTDAETYDKGRSEEFRLRFIDYCSQASLEKSIRVHKPRGVLFGGL